jgi:hypothetical protein
MPIPWEIELATWLAHYQDPTFMRKLTMRAHLGGVINVFRLSCGEEVESSSLERTRNDCRICRNDGAHLVSHCKLHLGLLLALRNALEKGHSQVPLVLDLSKGVLNLHSCASVFCQQAVNPSRWR